MGLKALIRHRQKMQALEPVRAIDMALELPGEPLIYCLKYEVGRRIRGARFFRNKAYKSILRCFFKCQKKMTTPVVFFVRFFVTPFDNVKISAKELKKESTPATMSFELCDYILSFLEMIYLVLINSYRQVVKIDVEKYYSDRPRTVFKFMTWEQYVKIYKDHHTRDTKSKSLRQIKPARSRLQSKRKRDGAITIIDPETARWDVAAHLGGTYPCITSFPNPDTPQDQQSSQDSATSPTTLTPA